MGRNFWTRNLFTTQSHVYYSLSCYCWESQVNDSSEYYKEIDSCLLM